MWIYSPRLTPTTATQPPLKHLSFGSSRTGTKAFVEVGMYPHPPACQLQRLDPPPPKLWWRERNNPEPQDNWLHGEQPRRGGLVDLPTNRQKPSWRIPSNSCKSALVSQKSGMSQSSTGNGQPLCICLSCQAHFCLFFMRTCVWWELWVSICCRQLPRFSQSSTGGREGKLLFTRSTANGLMRIFHDFWMFAELKAVETWFQGWPRVLKTRMINLWKQAGTNKEKHHLIWLLQILLAELCFLHS